MEMILTGIENKNEYYTNHYFTSIFQENAEDTIKKWKEKEKTEDIQLPWKKLRDVRNQYYNVRDRYLRSKNEEVSKPLIQEMALSYLNALGYVDANSVLQEVGDGLMVPIFHEETKANGAPLLWAFLSVLEERDDDILQGRIFEQSDDDEEYGESIDIVNDDVLAKLFFAGEEAPRFILLIGINQIALIDRNKWNEKRYLQFMLDDIYSRHEESTFMAMTVLLHKESLCPEDGAIVIDNLDENSHKHSAGVSDALKFALRESIEILGNEVIYDMKNRQGIDFEETPVDASELTLECLRYMYRFLFMLFIEARPELGYAPMKSQTYVQGYSLEGLRDVCDMVKEESEALSEGYYIDDTLKKLFHMTYYGYPEKLEDYKKAVEMESIHDAFTIEALKAHIFDPDYTKLITNARLRNSAMLQIVDLMSISRPSNAKERKGRISYSALGINQMGAVYEALLSYRGFIAEEDLYEVKRAGDKFNELDVGYFVKENELDNYDEKTERVRYESGEKKGQLRMYEKGTFIYRLAGREREKSASYYTPEVLTKCLVKYALKELLKDKTADEILHLTVCEPAMGSAAFLNEAINQLAEAYLTKKQEELGETISYDKRFEELQKVKMFIADRNVYGCDLNPVAVELAEVSLWLNTIYKGAYVPWFGTQLVNGNSLIGARRQVYSQSQLEAGKWYDKAPRRIMPGESRTKDRQQKRTKEVYHFLLGDPGMSNYTDKVIKSLEPDNIKKIKEWNKNFTAKFDEDDIETVLRLSDSIDDLWARTVQLRKDIEKATYEPLSVYGHEEIEESSHTTIREKDKIYRDLFKSERMQNAGPYARLKAAMDYWCALWFWPIDKADLLPSRQEFFFDMSLILEGNILAVNVNSSGQLKLQFDENNAVKDIVHEGDELAIAIRGKYSDLGEVCLDDLRERNERLAIANQIAKEQRFQHWELEFADVFAENGGFDLIVGNPPWVTVSWSEKDYLSDYYPIIQVKGFSSADIDSKRQEFLENLDVKSEYVIGVCTSNSTSNYFDAKANYPLLTGVQKDLYKCFVEFALGIIGNKSIVGFVHPEEIYNDSTNGAEHIRECMYKRLKYHFQFRNELGLFKDVGHAKIFSVSIFGNNDDCVGFYSINNLFVTNAIDECFSTDGHLEGIKDSNNNWSTRGHALRKIYFDFDSLKKVLKVFEIEVENPLFAKLPSIHTQSIFNILLRFGEKNNTVESISRICASEMFHETNSVKSKIIKREEFIPDKAFECILSGPNIGECTIYAKIPRINCASKGDYDVFNMANLLQYENYLPRVLFRTSIGENEYVNQSSELEWGGYHVNQYRLALKTLLSNSSEFNLKACILPKKVGHIQSIISFSFQKQWMLLYTCGLLSSLPYLFFFKITGKKKFSRNTINMFPIEGEDQYTRRIINRVLLLNCSSKLYSELWNENVQHWIEDNWLIDSELLRSELFNGLASEWNIKKVNLSDFERHQLFLEIDILTSKQLGISLEELREIYLTYFPNFKQSEECTWYDRDGKIIYTSNRSYSAKYNLSTSEFEKMDRMKEYYLHYEDTYDGNLQQKESVFYPPYRRFDRLDLYEAAWNNVN